MLRTEEAAEQLDADPSRSPWLSPRERWCRGEKTTNSVSLLDVLTVYGNLDSYSPTPAIFMSGCGVPVEYDSRTLSVPLENFGWNAAFVPLLIESLQIRTSHRSPHDKGRRIARLIKPWMTPEQIHALFGESKATISDVAEGRITYVDYGVSLDRNRNVICRDDSAEAKQVWWDWLTPPQERERQQQFNFFTGFTR